MRKQGENTELIAAEIRREVLKIGAACGVAAHFGGALSIVDMLSALFFNAMKHDPKNPRWADRDRFILSKGHGVLAYLATLYVAGYVDRDTAYSFQTNGSPFTAHPVKNLDIGVETSSGSLGQGLPFAVGLALALRRAGKSSRVFVICGDGECNEGAIWESLLVACNHGLSNLTILIDSNGYQNDGDVVTVSGSVDLSAICRGFGAVVTNISGHDLKELAGALTADAERSKPLVIVCETVKGKGVAFMENNNEWHHNKLLENQLEDCLSGI